jgi:tetratricopeptide (TPR) repeat protein
VRTARRRWCEGSAWAHNNRGNVYKELGQLDVALQCYERVIALTDGADAHFNRATVLQALGQRHSALASYGRALELNPAFAKAYNNRAIVLEGMNRFEQALADSRAALALQPDYAEGHATHGIVLFGARRLREALAAFKESLRLDPGNPDTWDKCGVAHRELKEFDEALACHEQAMTLGGERIGSMLNRGNVLRDRGQPEDAIASYLATLAIDPGFADAHLNLGTVYDSIGRRADSRAAYDRAIELAPQFALAHWNRSLIDLQDGRFGEGWRGYEWRWKTPSLGVYKEKREFDQPLWTGAQDLAGKTILVYSEQGYGDVLHFCRYLALVAARGARVVFETMLPLHGLMKSVEGVAEVVVRGEPLPPFDYQCPLLSLPLAFNTVLATIPAPARYLAPDAERVREWAGRLGAPRAKRIGIVWSGNPGHVNDRNRSIDFSSFARLFAAGAEFISLQKEVRPADQAALDTRAGVLQFSDALRDFADTAALCEQLDLVITVDTSVAHLAAALGKPTWVLLPPNSDWRWLRERSDSPWYPSMTLYRQQQAGDWAPLLDRVRADLDIFLAIP